MPGPTKDQRRYRPRHEPAPAGRQSAKEICGLIPERTEWTPLPENPRLPPAYDVKDIAAANACRHGAATPEQQKRFVDWCIWAMGTFHPTYRGNPSDSDYLQGRREGGLFIRDLVHARQPNQSNTEQG